MIEITLEEFIKQYKPVVVDDELEGINKYLNKLKNAHEIRLSLTYVMYFWTQIDNTYLLNGKIYADATGYIVCKEPHDIEEIIKVIV